MWDKLGWRNREVPYADINNKESSMDEQTGTEEALFDPSDFEVQEAEQSEDSGSPAVEATNEEQTASEEQASESTEVSTEEEKQEETQTGDAIDEFLAKKGIDKNDPQAMRKVVEMYQNAEKGFYQKSQEKAKLERELANSQPAQSTPDQQALSEVRALKTQMDVEKWKQEKKLTPETEQKMMDWFAQPIPDRNGNPTLDANGNPIIRGYLYTNGIISLDDVYNFVGGNVNTELADKKQNLTDELRNEVRKEMSARQAAKSTKQGSTNSTQFDKPAENDSFLEGLGF